MRQNIVRPTIHRGKIDPGEMRFALVVSRWNDFLTSRLQEGALDAFGSHNVPEDNVEIFMVPGSFELPLTSKVVAESGRFDAVVALGVVIRGETSHFDHVAGGAASGIQQAAMSTGIPVIFGVVTANTLEQAIDRCGVKSGNKGFEAALAAIETAHLHKQIKNKEKGKDRAVPHVA